MVDCPFTEQCIEKGECTQACPVYVQSSYLLERNNIALSNPVVRLPRAEIQKYNRILDQSDSKLSAYIVGNGDFTNQAADALTYCAICRNWRGSQLHCTVYNLRFGQYLEATQQSWSFRGNDAADKVEQMKIWVTGAKVLIISNLDFINFKDFQSQTLLSLLQTRIDSNLTTIVVIPPLSSLVGEGQFFSRLTSILNRMKVGDGR